MGEADPENDIVCGTVRSDKNKSVVCTKSDYNAYEETVYSIY